MMKETGRMVVLLAGMEAMWWFGREGGLELRRRQKKSSQVNEAGEQGCGSCRRAAGWWRGTGE